MSRADRSTLTMLIIIISTMESLKRGNAFSRLDIKALVINIKDHSSYLASLWYDDRISEKDKKKINDMVETWEREFSDISGSLLIVTVASQLVADLMTKIKNQSKIVQLNKLQGMCEELHQFADNGGWCDSHYRDADENLKILYRIIGFSL